MKTGSTADAGQTFVGAAERNGTTVAVVLMQAPTSFGAEATKLLDWGFSAVGSTQPIATLPAVAPGVSRPGSRPTVGPAMAPPAEDGGGVSPLLALALALTIVAGAFTYWQGREQQERDRSSAAAPGIGRSTRRRRTIRLPDADDKPEGNPDDAGSDLQPSSERDSRKIFAP